MLRRSLLSKKGGILPDDYIQLEYIENNSNAYIDTKYKPTNNTLIDSKLFVTKWGSWNAIFGARGVKSTLAYSLWCSNQSDKLFANFGSTNEHLPVRATVIHTVKYEYPNLYIDKTAINMGSETFSTPVTLFLFASNENGSARIGKDLRIYYFKIFEADTLIRNYIPAKRKSDGAIGLYDTVNDTFSLSPNGTKFIAGQEFL